MRPIKLSMRAFGPYSGEQVVDFRELGGAGLFLIHGPTGSGKTSILDAISFALYGAASGEDREPKNLRCQRSDPSEHTEVLFDFALGNRLYRVRRALKSSRSKTGEVSLRSEATLWLRTGARDDSEEGKVLASQPKRVDEEVLRLLGFSAAQFRQVVVLPQGQFQNLLLAGSSEKEKILETLFQTHRYAEIEERLKTMAEDLKRDLAREEDRISFLLAECGVGSIEELRERREQTSQVLQSLAKRRAELERAREGAREALDAARKAQEKLLEAERAKAALEDLEAHAAEFEEKERSRDRALRARELESAEAALETRAKEAAEAEKEEERARERLLRAKKTAEEAQAAETREAQREEERAAARREAERLESLTTKVAEISEARDALEAEKSRVKAAQDGKAALQARLEDAERSLRAAREERERAERIAAELGSRQAAAAEARRRKAVLAKLEQVRSQKKPLEAKIRKLRADLEVLDAHLSRAREEATQIESAWFQGQAAVLAQTLEPGKPCPVCGSTEHPSPARAEEELPSEEDVRRSKDSVRVGEKEREAAVARLHEAERKLSDLEARAATLEPEAQGSSLAEIEAALPQLEAAAEEAEKASSSADSARERERGAEAEIDRHRRGLEAAEEKLREALERFGILKGTLEAKEREVPEKLRSPEGLELAKAAARKRVSELDEALERARKASRSAAEELAKAQAALEEAKRTVEKARERHSAQSQEFARRLEEVGFQSPEDYRSAKLSRERCERLEKQIQDYRSRLEAAKARTKRALEEASGLEAKDLKELELKAAAAESELEQAVREEERWKKDLELLERSLAELEERLAARSEAERRFRVVGRLAEVAGGQNDLKMTLQRFVLGSLLDDVLLAASARLRTMSRGRYALQRARSPSDRRKASGLDLEVFDAYSGATRPVSTLSGGETFLAALSLALGLADVVQARTGGIYLETIFVDEGFGSLDPEALDAALQALVDLQGGGRLVGIISHVPELKERIGARLEVTAGRQGSTARFVLP